MVSPKSSKSVSMVLVVLMALLGMSYATLYNIEWNDNSLVDYKTWASEKKFHVGDVIVFHYAAKEDSVVRVTHNNFRSCNATDPIRVMDSGEDSVTVRSTHAHLYFISGFPGRCEAGQKVDIRVSNPNSHHPNSPPPSQPGASPAPAPGPDASVAEPSPRSTAKALVAIELLTMAIGALLY